MEVSCSIVLTYLAYAHGRLFQARTDLVIELPYAHPPLVTLGELLPLQRTGLARALEAKVIP